jgi:hypothetical protein
MTSDRDHLEPDPTPGEPTPADRGEAIRAYADGERSAAEVAPFRDEAFDRGVAFERALRDSTARVMGPVAAPAALRAKIEAMAREARERGEQDALAERLEARGGQTRDRGFWSSQRRLIGAMAAVLTLTLVGVFALQWARLSGPVDPMAYRARLARHVTQEHTRTLERSSYADAKYIYTTLEPAADRLGGRFEQSLTLPPCGEKTTFRGASPCRVPGKGPSAHFQFFSESPEGERVCFSIFIRRDHGELALDEHQGYLIDNQACGVEGVEIIVWRRDGLLYTLVCSQGGEMLDSLLQELAVSPPTLAHRL